MESVEKEFQGLGYIVGIKSNGSLCAWGNNYNGQLGDGTTFAQGDSVETVLEDDGQIGLVLK